MADNVTLNGSSGTYVAATQELPDGSHAQRVIPDPEPHALFRGRASTFRTPGRAGTTGQRLLTLHNATGSGRIVRVNSVFVDLYQTVVKAITVAPPVIRVQRITAVPTNGTALTKVPKDTALSSVAQIVATGDASADGTLSGTALAATLLSPNQILAQEYAPRFITAAGYEPMDRAFFIEDAEIVLRPGEGIVLEASYTATGQNPATDIWIAGVDWYEAA